MAFETLLGNRQLKENLSASLRRGHISHFYLISGPRGSGKHTLAKLLACALMCESDHRPCGACTACRKIMADTHPDFITVEDPEHKTLPVRMVREARESMFIRPNEGNRKIYQFPQQMGVEGQNALLKILEEPPPYGVFLILTDNPEQLLPTVRSRCTELALQAIDSDTLRKTLSREFPKAEAADIDGAIQRSGGFLGQARALLQSGDALPPQTEGFVQSFAARDTMGLLQVLVPMEKWKRDQLIEIISSWTELLEGALAFRSGLSATSSLERTLARDRSARELMEAIGALRKAREYAQGNVSPAAVCGWLEWALR